MNIRTRPLILYFLFYSFSVLSQQSEVSIKFDQVNFLGNTKTNTAYLHQIIECQENSLVYPSIIENDVQQLKNLPSIANASYSIDTIKNGLILNFIIEERRTKFPILNLGGIKDNLWFRIGLIENNFRGNNDLLLAYYQNNDRRHSAEVFFRRPRIKSGNWGLSSSLRKWSSIEPLYFDEGPVQYLYDNNSIGFSVIRNFGLRRNIELGGTYFQESYQQTENQDLENPPGPNNFQIAKFLSKFQINYNFLDYSFFYINGYSAKLSYQNVIGFEDNSVFNSLTLETKAFLRPINRVNIASRLILATSTNNDSPFAPFVADSHVNIRGIGNRIDRGTAQTVLNLELRITGLEQNYWASQFVAFSDFGSWRNPGGEYKDLIDSSNFRMFVGGGIRIIYQKVFGATFRLDYSVDIYNPKEKGFVIGLGQYF